MSKKLSNAEVNIYGLYTIGSGLGNAMPINYITIFMTDHLKIGAAIVGTILLIARILDFAVSLAAGPIVQNAQLKWGKYRSWLALLRWVAFLGTSLQFVNTSSLPLPVRLAIVVAGYFMLHFSMNFIALAQVGVLAAMAGTSMEDRARLSARSAQGRTLGTIITSATIVPLINFFTPKVGASNAYLLVAAPYALIMAITAGILVKASEPYDNRETVKSLKVGPAPTLKDMVESVVTNGQLLIYLSSYTLSMVAMMGAMGIATYYFAYVLGNFTLMAVSMTIVTFVGFLASLVGPFIGKKLGKKRAMVVGLLCNAIASVGIILLGKYSAVYYVLFSSLVQLGTQTYTCFGPNYVIDAGEYGYYKTGKDNRTVAMAMFNIPIKIGFALGGAVGTFGLAMIGYQAGMTVTPEFATNFMYIFGGIPALCYALGSLIMLLGYKISDEDAAMYARENAARAAKA